MHNNGMLLVIFAMTKVCVYSIQHVFNSMQSLIEILAVFEFGSLPPN